VLWASDSVRDEGAMVAFGMALLGVQPQWNSRGIVSGLQRRDLEAGEVRADTVFVTSGLFRDLFGAQMAWLDKSVLLAIDGSRSAIEKSHPELRDALASALAPLGPLERSGNEPLDRNHVARHWVAETQALMQTSIPLEIAGKQAALRVFGTAPGDYGAGINRLAERSGAWTNRDELAKVYVERLGHTYTADGRSAAGSELFRRNLGSVRNTYLGRASNLYGLMDNNDAFDYLGGLSLAVEKVSGKLPASFVVDHSNANKPQMQPLPAALVAELRGRYLNPAWIKPLMQHGYAGARTMGSEFTEYLWGWQVTNPDIIKSWAWDEVKAVYIDDREKLGLDAFLERDDNVHVKTNMMAILLVAAEKNFWQTDAQTLSQLSQQWVDLLLQHGLPGSGHTRADHPVFQYVQPFLRDDQREPLRQLLERSKAPAPQAQNSPSTISELKVAPDKAQSQARAQSQSEAKHMGMPRWPLALSLLGVLLTIGFVRGRYDHAGGWRWPRTSP
jgi:cobaltochelatase CobN